MRIHILTLFPGMFEGPFNDSVIKKAIDRGLLRIDIKDIRDYTHDSHHTADDYQYGGGAGMVMKPEPIFEAVEDARSEYTQEERPQVPVILLSPQGRVFNQAIAEELSAAPGMVLICGRYEGVDERVRGVPSYPRHKHRRLCRHRGGAACHGGRRRRGPPGPGSGRLGAECARRLDNFRPSTASRCTQDRPYTRDMEVPEVLLSGNHGEIKRWRRREALLRTLIKRPDLLSETGLSAEDLEFLRSQGYSPG